MLLAETLKFHRHEAFQFHVAYFLPWKDQMVERLRENGAVVHCFRASNNFRMLVMAMQVAGYAKVHKINVIHCHLPWAGFVGRIVAKFWGIPVIYTEHNSQERYHWLTFAINKLTYNWQEGVIAVSSDVASSIERRIAPRIPVRLVHNGVDTTRFVRDFGTRNRVRESLAIPNDAVVVGNLAVFRSQKRLKEWLDIFAEVASRHPNVFGILVGDGPLREQIDQHRHALGLQQRVFLPGIQTDVKPWYSAMDIFMMTSQFEGLPLGLLEAMSMECAVCTTDAGGIKEVVSNGKNGFIRATDAWRDLTGDLTLLLSDDLTRSALASEGRRTVVENYSLEKMVDELEGVYSHY